MGITDNFLAYQFNRIIELYGTRVDQLLEETKEVPAAKPKPRKGYYKTKPKYTLEKALILATKPEQRGMARVNSDFALMLDAGVTSMVD
jgi:hypothetical protein